MQVQHRLRTCRFSGCFAPLSLPLAISRKGANLRIRVSINGKHLTTGEVCGKGHLGAHINLDDKKGSGSPKMDVFVSGYDTNNPEETKYLKWLPSALKGGDHIAIELMPEAPPDEPIEVTSSLKDQKSISTSDEQADRILNVAYSCNEQLNELLQTLKDELSVEDYKKLAYWVSKVIGEVFGSIAEPIYRRHPSKLPEELKDMPL